MESASLSAAMTVKPLVYLLLSTTPLAAASNQEERLKKLESDVAELQTIVRTLDLRDRQNTPPAPDRPTPEPTRPLPSAQEHLIRTGDSYWLISRKYDVPVSALQRANPGISPRRLPIGKTIIIPGHLEPAQRIEDNHHVAPTISSTYTVRKGDILGRIAERHGIRLHQLLTANPGVNPRRLQIGTILQIPGGSPAPAPISTPSPELEPEPDPEVAPEPVDDYQLAPPPEIKGLGWIEDDSPALASAFSPQATKLITVESNMRLSEVASRHATSVAELNKLNEINLSPEQMIKTGSQLYVPGR